MADIGGSLHRGAVRCYGAGRHDDRGRRRELDRFGVWLRNRRPRPKLEDVNSDLVQRYLQGRSAFHGKSMLSSVMSKLRCWGEFLTQEGIWQSSPLRWMQGPRLDPRSRLPRRVSRDTLSELWRAAVQSRTSYHRWVWVTLLSLFYGTGARRGEIVRLDIADWNRDEGLLLIDGRKTGWESPCRCPELALPGGLRNQFLNNAKSRTKYGYDRAGNRVWRQNTVAEAVSKPFDELYGNDLIHRLKELSRGILNGNKDAVTDPSFEECGPLDATGNWQGFRQDDDGNGNWDLIQARTANTVNEITGISESTGPTWATPAYNAAGNMTTVPQPSDPTKTYTATYDAWNRLVKLVDDDTSDTVAEYQYDGANRRTVQKTYVGGVLDETRHLYYTQPSQWQVVEERIDAETDPDRQFVWGQRYIDDLVLRDRDTGGDGSLDERLYALQDANWNVTGLIDASGDVQERFAYSAYGTPLFLTSAFAPQESSSFNWETLYAGYRWETATELFHVRHRVLNSVIGTWCQRDPLLNAASSSILQYVEGNPLVRLDPFGLKSQQQVNCESSCGDFCYSNYYSSWWPPSQWQYMWCIDSCYAQCAGNGYDVSGVPCRIASAFGDECMREFIQCACFMAGDFLPSTAIGERLPKHAQLFLAFFECACEALTVLQKGCEGDPGVIGYAYIGLLDCGVSIGGAVDPGFGKAFSSWNLAFELAEQFILEGNHGFGPPGLCVNWKSDAPTCWRWAGKVDRGECQPIADYFK